jgi:hypothetical protein
MTPELAKSWIEVLTAGRGLLITAAIVVMFAGLGLSLLIGFVLWNRWGGPKKLEDRIAVDHQVAEALIEVKAGIADMAECVNMCKSIQEILANREAAKP